jgi:hypothetical protein
MKHIVLIDFSLVGHHLSFIRSFSKILIEQGHTVSCLVPSFGEVESWIYETIPGKTEKFRGFEYSFVSKKAGIHKKVNHTIEILQRWKNDKDLIRKIENERHKKVDLVFYAWIDSHIGQYLHPILLDLVFPFNWVGLYFHPFHLRLQPEFLSKKANWRDWDSAFLSKNCLAVAVHDLTIVEKFSSRITKKVIHFPETADATSPDFSNEQYKSIRQNAKGRIVIGMIACEKHKGTLTMMRMAKEANDAKYYFAFLGVLPQQTYSEDEWLEVQEFIHSGKENCFFYFHPIPEGAMYNAVFCAFDIPFLGYDHFISSSNRLTKAAIFKKLVLASDNYCVGDDVKKYDLGVTVVPVNYKAALAGLEMLSKRIQLNDFPQKKWEEYVSINSEERLNEKLRAIIKLI